MTKGMLIATAVAGLFVSAGTSMAFAADQKDGEQVVCSGINECKGHGTCAGAGHSCAGQNGCKGQGHSKVTKKVCLDKGGKVVKPAK